MLETHSINLRVNKKTLYPTPPPKKASIDTSIILPLIYIDEKLSTLEIRDEKIELSI